MAWGCGGPPHGLRRMWCPLESLCVSRYSFHRCAALHGPDYLRSSSPLPFEPRSPTAVATPSTAAI
eukprot:4098567-Prymnesium_polylepis.1